MAPRGKRAKAVETKASGSSLAAALRFIAVAQKDAGQAYETHCTLAHNTAVAFNGVLAAGVKIAEDIIASPHTKRLIDALERCGETFAITQLDSSKLSIKSEKFKAVIPCIEHIPGGYARPDAPCAVINDSLKEGFNVVSAIVSDNSEFMVTASILLRANTMVSTNRHVLLEFWHGIDLPPRLIIPKAAALAVAKSDKTLTQLGFSPNSVTFWFDDGAWIKTQQYSEEWPNVDRLLNCASDPTPIPETFYHALNAVAPFAEDNRIFLRDNSLCSHSIEGIGATYEVEGIPSGLGFNAKYLKIIEPYAKQIDFVGNDGKTFFFGDKVRGIVMQIR